MYYEDEIEEHIEEPDRVAIVIKCTNPNCYTSFKRESISLMNGEFSCPCCGWEEYNRIELPYPKKRKDHIEFINRYNEDYE